MGVAFLATRRRWGPRSAVATRAPIGAALRDPRVRLQAAIFFVRTGLEASAGQWAFTVLRCVHGWSAQHRRARLDGDALPRYYCDL